MNRFKNALYRFMAGRYGNDTLNNCILTLIIVLMLLNMFWWKNGIVVVVVWALLMLNIFRSYSRNIYKRRMENTKFLALVKPVTKRFSLAKKQKQDKEHRYFICPSCSQNVRVPKGKGKIVIKCPKCGNKFERKS
ncbi:MAG: hypothetical protein EOM50_10195 [Erysipelotrichia bacterium]|nr:hypothetical protein [Erysipelotrichia bacterium]NCC55310.1 hypothetical protein [Erysipelotrichia bacterium]